MLIGFAHLFFGVSLISLQVAAYIMLHYYWQWGLFEGRFAPGAWLGGWILITGILGVVHGCNNSKKLRLVVVAFNIIAAVLAVIMLGLAIGWRLLDPEGFLFSDCEYPFLPWIYYYAPHCEVEFHVKIFGATMMAIACLEMIFGFVAAIVVGRERVDEEERVRDGKRYRKPGP